MLDPTSAFQESIIDGLQVSPGCLCVTSGVEHALQLHVSNTSRVIIRLYAPQASNK